MKRPAATLFSLTIWASTAGFLLLTAGACNHHAEHPPTIVKQLKAPFQPITYRLTRLDVPAFLDSLRSLPRADSTLVKHLMTPGQHDTAFDSATAYHLYRTFPFGQYRAEVVAVISDFNTVSGSLQLLLFTTANQWISTVALASHYDEAGATEEATSVQISPFEFRQQKVTTEVLQSPVEQVNKPDRELSGGEYLGVGITMIHAALRLDGSRLTRTRLDSTYREQLAK